MSTEQAIKRALLEYQTSNDSIDDFMKKKHKSRKMSLDKDTYISVCVFLKPHEIIKLTTSCKEYMKYYPYIWDGIQKYYFPKSLISNTDYKIIRQNIAIDRWYHLLNNERKNQNPYINPIIEMERESYEQDQTLLDPEISKELNGELFTDKDRESYIINIDTWIIDSINEMSNFAKNIFHDFRQFSIAPTYGNTDCLYYAVKPDLDLRLYGLNPNNEYDVKLCKESLDWINGIKNSEKDYGYDITEYPNYMDYIYGNDLSQPYRCLIKPTYLLRK
jgi:hypothetical protein